MARKALQARTTMTARAETWTEQEARAVLEAWKQSGETCAEFARQNDLVAQRLFYWRKRLGLTVGLCPPSAPPTFLPVTVRGASVACAEAPIVVTAPGGVRIEVASPDASSAAWVATLLRSLGEGAS